MICAGIDAGSRAIKIVLLDAESLATVASGMAAQGVRSGELALQLFHELLNRSGRSLRDVGRVIATGYARNAVSVADSTITEITCHAAGVRHLVPEARTIIEIGGQDSKLLRLSPEGNVYDFAMNDRCAAGTGRFLEVVADRLGVELEALGEMAARSRKPAAISSTCIVFAETEIIGLLAGGAAPEDIAAGVQNSIVTRISSMIGRSITPPVIFTGGVALVSGMGRALERVLGQPVRVAPEPHMTGALGAALLASRQSQIKT